jgi:hypothetical protein
LLADQDYHTRPKNLVLEHTPLSKRRLYSEPAVVVELDLLVELVELVVEVSDLLVELVELVELVVEVSDLLVELVELVELVSLSTL